MRLADKLDMGADVDGVLGVRVWSLSLVPNPILDQEILGQSR